MFVMENQTQTQWLRWFSRAGFFLSWIYLLRARQYLFVLFYFVISFALWYFLPNLLLSFLISLIMNIMIGIKGRQLAFDTSKKTFDVFQYNYKKISKIFIIIFVALVWVVVVWVFAVAIVPRLSSVQWRANDVQRKADLYQIAAGLTTYQTNYWDIPRTWWSLDTIKDIFVNIFMTIPQDPNKKTSFDWLLTTPWTPWQYMYIPLPTHWTQWFALLARTETEQWSNRVFDKNLSIEKIKDINSLTVCTQLEQSSYVRNMNNGLCYYVTPLDLGYIYISSGN